MIKEKDIEIGGRFLYRAISLTLILIMVPMVIYSVQAVFPIKMGPQVDGVMDVLNIFIATTLDFVLVLVFGNCIREYFRTTPKTDIKRN